MFWKINTDNNIREAELRHNPVIITVNEFDEEAAQKFCSDMAKAQNTGQPVVPVIIDSYGGQVYSLMRMIDAINSSTIPVATIVEGKAMSCGVVLASHGTKGHRYVSPNATLMVHDVSSGAFGKNSEIQSSAEETQRLNKKIYKILADNTGRSPKWFHKKINKMGRADWFVTPEEAKDLGFSDHIGLPTLTVSVGVSYDFKL
jgi:ATP-dependent Clp protease protease subunit